MEGNESRGPFKHQQYVSSLKIMYINNSESSVYMSSHVEGQGGGVGLGMGGHVMCFAASLPSYTILVMPLIAVVVLIYTIIYTCL